MQQTITAIEAATRLPDYQRMIASRENTPLPALTRHHTHGIFMGYDFHLSADGPRLIEINTNAGGGFLVQGLLSALAPTRPGSSPYPLAGARLDDPTAIAQSIVNMFTREWLLGQRSRPCGDKPGTTMGQLRHIAIVDQRPDTQYLYPDMLMARALLQSRGIAVSIVDPANLQEQRGRLVANGQVVDMVYNRLTDFALCEPYSEVLQRAHNAGAAVISPAPQHHALFADKRNLAVLSDRPQMRRWGLGATMLSALGNIAATSVVSADNADVLWQRRKELFFKPARGYGSKAVYRGGKLTRKTWRRILEENYVAQQLIEPAQRQVFAQPGMPGQLKYDLRVYAYAGTPLALAARVYRGQTTNFRTPGGGFAPVVVLPQPLIEAYADGSWRSTSEPLPDSVLPH